MTPYTAGLFLHVVGALGFFATLGLEWMGLLLLRRSVTAEQALESVKPLAPLRWLYPASGITILVSGGYMIEAAWGWAAWIVISLAALVLLAASGPPITGPRLAAIVRTALAESGPISSALHRRLRDPLLLASHQTRTAIALGIVFLMTVKPALGGSLLVIGVAVVLGLVSSLPLLSRDRAKEVAV